MPIIVTIQGGLANQMFQYAFALSLKQHGKNVILDTSLYIENDHAHNGYELENVFNINENYATPSLIKPYLNKRRALSTRVGKYHFQRHLLKYYSQSTKKRFGYAKNSFVYDLNDAYLLGYWQSEKFFLPAKEQVLKAFNFDHLSLSKENKTVEKAIFQSHSVGIHVRRGDYVNHPQLGEICTKDYYKNAIKNIQSMVSNPIFFIFSNDITWCKEQLNISNTATYIDWNNDAESFFDLYLMSRCKHNIIANSSFSWWAAYLNKNDTKITCAPSIWFNDSRVDDKDIYQSDWIKING